MQSIFEFFPYDKPRPGQVKVLEWLEKNWDRYDVFVLQAPVAAGKTGLALTISRWLKQTNAQVNITVPDNVLLRQYTDEVDLPTLGYRSDYPDQDDWERAKDQFRRNQTRLMNWYTLLSSRMYAEVQIMDEAHQLIPMLQDFEGGKWWFNDDPIAEEPELMSLRTVGQWLMHFMRIKKELKGIKNLTNHDKRMVSHAGKMINKLSKKPDEFIINSEIDIRNGKAEKLVRIYPLTPKSNKPILWPPSKVKKMVLMSATIGKSDIKELGLDRKRVGYIEIPSDIPAENRPVFYTPVGSMAKISQKNTLPALREKLEELSQRNSRGFIHTTYGISADLKMPTDTFVTHYKWDKKAKLSSWLSNIMDRRPFIGCGLHQGLNLKEDLCRWQAITKCQYPDLGNPAVLAKAQQDPEWYAWSTIKIIVQSYGRVCRGPEDAGATYILDSDFARLYSKWSHLFPNWFKEAIQL